MHHHGQDCLRLKVDVGQKGSGKAEDEPKVEKKEKEAEDGKGRSSANGGVHNPSNRLSAGEDSSETLHSPVGLCLAGPENSTPIFFPQMTQV